MNGWRGRGRGRRGPQEGDGGVGLSWWQEVATPCCLRVVVEVMAKLQGGVEALGRGHRWIGCPNRSSPDRAIGAVNEVSWAWGWAFGRVRPACVARRVGRRPLVRQANLLFLMGKSQKQMAMVLTSQKPTQSVCERRVGRGSAGVHEERGTRGERQQGFAPEPVSGEAPRRG